MSHSVLVLAKSHVNTYTRKDGVVVQAHDDKRQAAMAPTTQVHKHTSDADADAWHKKTTDDLKADGHQWQGFDKDGAKWTHPNGSTTHVQHSLYSEKDGWHSKVVTSGGDGPTSGEMSKKEKQDLVAYHEKKRLEHHAMATAAGRKDDDQGQQNHTKAGQMHHKARVAIEKGQSDAKELSNKAKGKSNELDGASAEISNGKSKPLTSSQVDKITDKHNELMTSGGGWGWDKGDSGKIPSADVAHVPEFSHADVYGADNKSAKASDDFTPEFKAKGHQGFVVKQRNGDKHFVDTQGYDYARKHASVGK